MPLEFPREAQWWVTPEVAGWYQTGLAYRPEFPWGYAWAFWQGEILMARRMGEPMPPPGATMPPLLGSSPVTELTFLRFRGPLGTNEVPENLRALNYP